MSLKLKWQEHCSGTKTETETKMSPKLKVTKTAMSPHQEMSPKVKFQQID